MHVHKNGKFEFSGQSLFSLWNLRVLYNTSIEKTVIKHGLKEVNKLLGEANSS